MCVEIRIDWSVRNELRRDAAEWATQCCATYPVRMSFFVKGRSVWISGAIKGCKKIMHTTKDKMHVRIMCIVLLLSGHAINTGLRPCGKLPVPVHLCHGTPLPPAGCEI